MSGEYNTYHKFVWGFSILLLFFVIGICIALGITSKKKLSPTSSQEELENEDKTFLSLFTGFFTFIAMGTIFLSHIKLNATHDKYNLKNGSLFKGEHNKLSIHKKNYSHYLRGIGNRIDPENVSDKNITEGLFTRMPYKDALVITSGGILLCSFIGVFLFSRTLFCKRLAYSGGGGSNLCCPLELSCPNKSKSVGKPDWTIDLDIGTVAGTAFSSEIQNLVLKRPEKSPFLIDIGNIPVIPNNIPAHFITDIGFSGTLMTGGASGVSCHIPPSFYTPSYDKKVITQFLLQCIGISNGGLCRTHSSDTEDPTFYILSNNSTSLELGVEHSGALASLSGSGEGPVSWNGTGKFTYNPVSVSYDNLLIPWAHSNLYWESPSATTSSSDMVCIDPGIMDIKLSCSKYKFLNVDGGPSQRWCEGNGPNGFTNCKPACFEVPPSNSHYINNSDFSDSNGYFERNTGLVLRGGTEPGTGGNYAVNFSTIAAGDLNKVNTNNYTYTGLPGHSPYKNSSQPYSPGDTPQNNTYTAGGAFCWSINGKDDPLLQGPNQNEITKKGSTSYPKYPNAFTINSESKSNKVQMGFKYELPKKKGTIGGFLTN